MPSFKRFSGRLSGFGVALVLIVAGGSAVAQEPESLPDPAEMVDSKIDEILSELEARQAEMEGEPDAAYEFIQELLLPVFDVPYATRMVMGRHGRDASPSQRREFGQAFYRFLVRSYADALVEYDPSSFNVEVYPVEGEPDPRRTRVRTEILRESDEDIPVDYTLRYTDDGWKVYDVTVEGVSYVTNYRNSFDSEIRQRGLDAVIERLQREAEEATESSELVDGEEEETEGNGESSDG